MFKLVTVIVFVSLLSANFAAKNEEYKGYKIYNIKLETKEQENIITNIKSDLIDILRRPSWKYKVVGKVMVPPSHFNWFEDTLAELGIENDVFVDDVFEYLKEKDSISSRNIGDTFDFNGYHRYDVILNHLYNLEERYENSAVKFEVIQYGVTEENRPLIYVKVTNDDGDENKPVAVIEAAINPRDWVTVPSAMNVIKELLEDENKNMLDDLIWIIVPVLNPDGYEYTHTNLRLWTKSRSLRSHLDFICPGVNINRNFNIDWLKSDSSSSPCSHIYAGTEPGSEPETQLINHIIKEFNPALYISLQNIGKIITFPWSYEKAASGLFRRHFLLGLQMKPHDYILDSGAIAFGDRVSGTSVDYARRTGAFYTYTVGVDGDGEEGVFVSAENIGKVADDVWNIVAAAARGLELN